jgi:large exoprotein involved in heme utilization and adhesion
VDRDASGRGGNVSIDAREVTVRNGGRISVGTLGPGPAGSLTVVADAVRLSGGGLIESNSGDAMSPHAGRGGDVTVIAHRSIEADGGSRISGRSERNDAGTVTLLTPGTLLLRNSEVTTAADLSGGNIFIDPEFVVLNNSRILANARLRSGGNITIQAQNYLPSVGSLVDASSEESTPGAITIDARVVDIAGSIAALESGLADTRSLLLEACGMRVGAAASTFVVTGRGGMPAEPGGWSSDVHDLLGIPLREAPVRPSRPGGAAPRR